MNDDRRTHGLWEASAPPAPVTHSLNAHLTADVVIVGAGFTGLSAALHLAQGGADVVVLEAQAIGFGGSGRNVGLINAGMWVPPAELPQALGNLYGQRLLQALGNGPDLVFELIEQHGIQCEAVRAGTLHCAVGARGLADITERARQWQALGAPVHVLDAAATQQKTGTDAYAGSLLDLRAGTLQPLAYARGLSHAALHAGARIFTGSPVAAVQDHGTHWQLATAAHGSVSAKWVIVATNAYTSAQGVWSAIRSELVGLPYFNMATVPLSAAMRSRILPERQGAWDTRQVLSSMRMDRAGRLVFGSVGALAGPGQAIHTDWGRRALARLYPELKGVAFEHEWYGTIGMTGNSLPRFHTLARQTVSFSGYNGRGIAPGTVLGRELARLVSGQIRTQELPLPESPVEPVVCRWAREAWYEVGAQIVHGAGARLP
ncbi:MAG: FAD-binding oxidoreductase [Burkholderiaceae bacterium]